MAHLGCASCGEEDTAEHTFFVCPRWEEERARCADTTGTLTPEGLMEVLLRNEECWAAVTNMARNVLTRKG